jgi:hypothetical protein
MGLAAVSQLSDRLYILLPDGPHHFSLPMAYRILH